MIFFPMGEMPRSSRGFYNTKEIFLVVSARRSAGEGVYYVYRNLFIFSVAVF